MPDIREPEDILVEVRRQLNKATYEERRHVEEIKDRINERLDLHSKQIARLESDLSSTDYGLFGCLVAVSAFFLFVRKDWN
jgi:hypothetical protein